MVNKAGYSALFLAAFKQLFITYGWSHNSLWSKLSWQTRQAKFVIFEDVLHTSGFLLNIFFALCVCVCVQRLKTCWRIPSTAPSGWTTQRPALSCSKYPESSRPSIAHRASWWPSPLCDCGSLCVRLTILGYVRVCVYGWVAETEVLFLPCKDKAGGVKIMN